MKFTANEFIVFAKKVQSNKWHTLTQKRMYRYSVEDRGLRVILSTGKERLVSNWEIVRFCEIYNQSNSIRTRDYSDLFNKSYLLPIAKSFDMK